MASLVCVLLLVRLELSCSLVSAGFVAEDIDGKMFNAVNGDMIHVNAV